MAYLVELDVNEYGVLTGGEEDLPVSTVDHDWFVPYPLVETILPVEWEPGERGTRPRVFWHPSMRDWVCDEPTQELLTLLAPHDVHRFARARLDDQELHVVQAVAVLDVVDESASVFEDYEAYRVLQFPAFRRDAAELVETRVFRIPQSFTDVFVGETIKRELEAARVTGLRYVAVDWSGGGGGGGGVRGAVTRG